MKKGCCTNKLTTLKIKDDLSTPDSQILKAPCLKEFTVGHPFVQIESLSIQYRTTSVLFRPPPNNLKVPCYLFNKVILI